MKIGSNQINWCNNIVQFSEEASKMSKRTKKVGITGKYGTRYKDKLFCELDWKLTLGISGMVLPWGRPSRRWRSLSTRSTCAPSVARTRWRGRPPASGSATTRTAESRWLEVPTLTPPPPRPPSGSRKKNGKYFSKQQQHSVFPLNCGRIQFFMLQDRLVLYSPYIHRVCSDHYGSYNNDCLCFSCTRYYIFLDTNPITSSLSGLPWGGWGRWRRPKCCANHPSFVPLKTARTIQNWFLLLLSPPRSDSVWPLNITSNLWLFQKFRFSAGDPLTSH